MKDEFDVDEMIKGIDFDAMAATSTTCDSPVKPLTMDTLLEAKKLLQQGYKPLESDWKINIKLLLGYKIRKAEKRLIHITS